MGVCAKSLSFEREQRFGVTYIISSCMEKNHEESYVWDVSRLPVDVHF